MTTRDHSMIEELLAVKALGGLDGSDDQILAREMGSHGACGHCRRLEREFADVAAQMGLSLDPVALDPDMVDRIVATQRDGEAAVGDAPSRDEIAERRSRHGRRLAAAVAIAAAFALVVGGTVFLERTTTKVGAVSSKQQVVHFTVAPDTTGRLAVAYTPGETGALLWGSDMQDPGVGKVYEVWMIANGTPVSGGCLSPADGRVATYVPANLDGVAEMAVTMESDSCPGAPTSTPIMTAQLIA